MYKRWMDLASTPVLSLSVKPLSSSRPSAKEARYLDILTGDASVVFNRMSAFFETLMLDDEYIEDVLRQDLFKPAMAKLGTLHADECYGFLPPLAMGGSESVDALKRVKLREHLAIAAQSLG
jgi:hypothetical protein